MTPNQVISQIEAHPILPAGEGDRSAGYGVIGLPFRSGHVLALRRFPASSIGPGYTSVWHRDPTGIWTFYSNISPGLGCSRYFGDQISVNAVVPIRIEWPDPTRFVVRIGTDVRWEVTLAESWATRLLNAAATLVPDAWWHTKPMLKAMSVTAGLALGTGEMNLTGKTPNGHEFVSNPRRVWLIDSSRVIANGKDLGPMGPLPRQVRLGDVFIPQRGVFAVARAFLRTPLQTSVRLREAA